MASYSSDSDAHITSVPGVPEQQQQQERTSALEEPLLQPSHLSDVPLSEVFESASDELSSSSGTHSGLLTHHGVIVSTGEGQRSSFSVRGGTQVVDEGIAYSSQQRLRSGSRESTVVEIHDNSNN